MSGESSFFPIVFLTSGRGVQSGDKGFWERHCLTEDAGAPSLAAGDGPGRREEGNGTASAARGLRRKEETSPGVDSGASGSPRGGGCELQCCHTQESQLQQQEFLSQGQPAQHFPNGGTSLSRAMGFCRDSSGTCWPEILLPCLTHCLHLQGQGSQPSGRSCMRSLTKYLVPSLVWKNPQDQQLTLLDSL